MRWPTAHEKVHDALGLWRKMRQGPQDGLLRILGEFAGLLRSCTRRPSPKQFVGSKQRTQRQRPQTQRSIGQEMAAVKFVVQLIEFGRMQPEFVVVVVIVVHVRSVFFFFFCLGL